MNNGRVVVILGNLCPDSALDLPSPHLSVLIVVVFLSATHQYAGLL